MAYLLSNIYTKNYWNPTTIVETIVGGLVVSFFETQCRPVCFGKPGYYSWHKGSSTPILEWWTKTDHCLWSVLCVSFSALTLLFG